MTERRDSTEQRQSRARHSTHEPGPRLDEGYFPLRQLAVYSGLSVRTLRAHLTHRSHPLPHYRMAGKILVKRSDFDDWMGAFRADGPSAVDEIVAQVLKGL